MSETDPKSENDNDETPPSESKADEVAAEDLEAEEDESSSEPSPNDGPAGLPEEALEEGEPSPDQRIIELEAALAHSAKERLLALAEAENAGKRADKRISDNAKYGTSNICKSILQVADNLERALLAAPVELRSQNDVVKNLAVGVEMTAKELTTVLEGQRVTKFVSLDQPFDPNRHQAMQELENQDLPAGTVVQVVQEGYMMADRLLRPAMVVISKGGPKREPADTESDEQRGAVDQEV
ncbi:MAG: nucleotide exchange factor GrpE [Rhodospirillaceae bacterium]